MKPEHEKQIQSDELAGDRIFAACFACVFYSLAIFDGWLTRLCRKLKGRK